MSMSANRDYQALASLLSQKGYHTFDITPISGSGDPNTYWQILIEDGRGNIIHSLGHTQCTFAEIRQEIMSLPRMSS